MNGSAGRLGRILPASRRYGRGCTLRSRWSRVIAIRSNGARAGRPCDARRVVGDRSRKLRGLAGGDRGGCRTDGYTYG